MSPAVLWYKFDKKLVQNWELSPKFTLTFLPTRYSTKMTLVTYRYFH